MRFDDEALAVLPAILLDGELPLTMGAGKITAYDREWVYAHAARGGRGGLNAAEATWVATNLRLLYLAPRLSRYVGWLWPTIQLRLLSRGLVQSTVAIEEVDGDVHELVLAKARAADLVNLGNRISRDVRDYLLTSPAAPPPIDVTPPGPRKPTIPPPEAVVDHRAAVPPPSGQAGPPRTGSGPTVDQLHEAGDLSVAADLWLRRHRNSTAATVAIDSAADLTRRAATFVAELDLSDPVTRDHAVRLAAQVKGVRDSVKDQWGVTIDKHGNTT